MAVLKKTFHRRQRGEAIYKTGLVFLSLFLSRWMAVKCLTMQEMAEDGRRKDARVGPY